MPIIQDRAHHLFDAADILEVYQASSSKERTRLLAELGYTSAADIYRGLEAYLAKDEPITPQTLRNAAQNIQSPMAVGNYEIQTLLKQAAERGKQTNLLNELIGSTGAKGVDATKPIDVATLWQLINAGGATGLRKKTATATAQGAIDPSTGKPVK
jgi:hypothetical protein